ncbi:hypothetical protein BIZ38_10335 [Pseudoalteromonas sp. BZK2]|mgnify:CR=1 FL=1|uniref:hypothetical protein n=1 Tax=Pseudoalteromonas sp. BZK2 TaxID=1904458 RepID=UPI001654B417|nr:hypothetical protein [Pseudoalteromonas sp. BZK2]MBC7008873.1 hypothetical protein [Pseudoalteromonas sp. BZK2]
MCSLIYSCSSVSKLSITLEAFGSEVIHKGRTLCTVIANVYKSDAPDIPVALATATFNRYQLKQ